jgi:hypothetical protein
MMKPAQDGPSGEPAVRLDLWLPKILSRRSIAFQSGELLTEWSVL